MGLKWKLLIPLNAAVIVVMLAAFHLQQLQVEDAMLKQERKRLTEEVAFLSRDIDPAKSDSEIVAATVHFCMSMASHGSPKHQVIVERGRTIVGRGMPDKPNDLETILLSAPCGTNVLPYRNSRIVVNVEEIGNTGEAGLTVRVADDLSDMDRQLSQFHLASGISIVVATLVLLIIVNMLIHFLATRPATVLGRTISEIDKGNFNVVLPRERTHEFAVISDALGKMTRKLAEAEASELREMEEAAKIQRHILPSAAMEIPGVEHEFRYIPCEKIGGDYCDILQLKDGAWAIIVGDVSGHGVPAALTTTMLKVLLEHHLDARSGLAESMAGISLDLGRYLPYGNFATLFCALYFPESGILKYCSAGHPSPLLLKPGADPIQLSIGGPALGILPRKDLQYSEGETNLSQGDILVFFTDGLTERSDRQENQFGVDRLIETCKKGVALRPREMVSLILDKVERFGGEMPQDDDIAILIARVK